MKEFLFGVVIGCLIFAILAGIVLYGLWVGS